MDIYELDVHQHITDLYIKYMKLQILEAHNNQNITNDIIKYMALYRPIQIPSIDTNSKITNDCIKNKNLQVLDSYHNITDSGIKHMNLLSLLLERVK